MLFKKHANVNISLNILFLLLNMLCGNLVMFILGIFPNWDVCYPFTNSLHSWGEKIKVQNLTHVKWDIIESLFMYVGSYEESKRTQMNYNKSDSMTKWLHFS